MPLCTGRRLPKRLRTLPFFRHEASEKGSGHAETGPPVSRCSVVRRCMEQARTIHAPCGASQIEFTEFEGGEATSPIMDIFRRHKWQGTTTRRARRRAGVREATDRAEDVIQTGIQAAQRVAEEFSRVLGVGGQNENLTRQATQNLEAITETGSVLMRGFQDVSREWLELLQERLRKNAEGMTKLAQCRTLPDLAAVQSDLARDNLNQIVDVTRRIAERSMKVADEAAKTITAETGKAGRYSRAA